ncbi:hydrolase [Neisseria arctica]|uniref:Hydrolase n=1 Tax=Neisseria arctica TaxID=1470200 RepID=A0A0J1C3X3_9NEIS|nr:pyrimidine 5'-nucleotidase [Neisseria arctica]KLT72998.1 hydrolase [Neisseria arctica]UOO86713.1 pyrimidine 5'-nucleotidase [Neisseria arctica]
MSPVWLFDFDNTLHHADAGIFDLINQHMTVYLANKLKINIEQASYIRKDYWHRYGATLAGLQLHHPEIDIYEFLQCSHPLEKLSEALVPMVGSAETLAVLKGRKIVFSNGPSFYIQSLIKQLGLEFYFEALLGTDDLDLAYKPSDKAYLNVCQIIKVMPSECIMVDDSLDNLRTAKALGMQTVWFGQSESQFSFVDFTAINMAALAEWGKTL